MGLLAQLGLLLWKNFILRKRQKIRLLVELVWPLFLFFILVWVRSTNQPVNQDQCHYPNKAMPSAGILPWLQGMVCNINNPCLNHPTEGETPGQVNNFNSSVLTGVMVELQSLVSNTSSLTKYQRLSSDVKEWLKILQNSNPENGQSIQLKNILKENETFTRYLKENLSVPLFVAESVKMARINLSKVIGLSRDVNLNHILCNKTELKQYIVLNSSAAQDIFQNISCSLTPQQLEITREVLLRNLDTQKLAMAVPLAVNLNPTETFLLAGQTVTHALPIFEEISKLQNSILFNLSNTLDFRSNIFGSLNILLCGKTAVVHTDYSTSNSSAPQSMWNQTASEGNNSVINSTNNNSSAFCQSLIATLENSPPLRYVWSTFRPLLLGKILYTPDTPAVNTIIKEANHTFRALGMLKELGEAWEIHGPLIWDFLQRSTEMNSLRALLNNPVAATLLNLQINGTGWTAERLSNFLYNGPPEGRRPGMPTYDWRNSFNYTSEALRTLTQFLGCLALDKFEAAPNEERLIEKSMKLIQEKKFWAGIVFEAMDTKASQPPPFVKYKIRMDIDEVERTTKVKERLWAPGARDNSYNDLRYIWGGFAYLQDMMDHGIIRTHTSKSQPLGVFVQQMPYPCYVNDVFIQYIGNILPMFLVLAFVFSTCMIIKGLVQEKELRHKEVLRMVGVKNSVLWFAWFMDNFLVLLVPSALICLMVKFGKVLRYSDPSVLFVFLVVFCISTIMECFFISVFFSKANLAAACGGIIYFVLYLPHVLCFSWQDILTFNIKIIVSLLSCVAFGFGCENFSRYEEQGIGIQWSNIGVSPVDGDRYSLVVSIFMMLIDSFIYWVLTWYIENVFPGQYGIPRSWYFPFTASYWCGMSTNPDGDPALLTATGANNVFIEAASPDLKPGVSIRNLVKVYNTGKKLAVDGLSVDFYQDQITSFLGHNGAGKTTTMSILTGLFPPTSGTAFIYGKDIRTEMDAIRNHMGMCPQHNVLFNEMTVEEHIYFYARLKGRSSNEVKSEMDQMIKDVGLPHKRKELVKNLSGGMQRKLSVAIAFVGGSKIVILDEPTAGVDPYARRGIWELLLKYKQGRTIILSTHHMDEADILGDRITIISHGKMCCCGSSLFLKKCFGSGYYLTLVSSGENKMSAQRSDLRLAEGAENDDVSHSGCSDEGIGSESGSDQVLSGIKALNDLIKQYVPEARFLESIGQEITYILPYTGAQNGTFAKLFKELDLEISNLGITSYGISDTTLEEIFLKVAEDTGVDVETADVNETFVRDWKRSSRISKQNSISNVGKSSELLIDRNEGGNGKFINRVQDSKRPDSMNGKGSHVITGWKLIRRQFLALFIKRFHHARRSRKGLIAQVVLPAVFVCLSLIFSLIVPPFVEYPRLELQPWIYGAQQKTFFSNDAPDNMEVSRAVDSLVNKPGFGTRCMGNNPIPNLPCAYGSDWYTPKVDPATSEILANGNWTMANPSPPCQCSTPQKYFSLPYCPLGAGGWPPPERIQNTTDTLQNLTGRNVTDFLLKTYQKSGKMRYGGISVGGVNSQVRMNETEIAALLGELKNIFNSSEGNLTDQMLGNAEMFMKELGTKDNVKVWFYNVGWHAMVSFLNVANNAILRGNLRTGQDPRDFGITTYNHPLNLTKEQLSDMALATTSTDVVVSICVIFAMSFIPASFVLFLIQERVTKAKHLQFVSGVNPGVYWIANFAWDMCNYIIPCLIVIIIFLCFQQKAYVSSDNLPALILLLILYGWSITPLMYPASFLFSIPSTAYVVLTCVNLFIGINGSVATFVMELFNDESVTQINNIVKQVLLIFPHFCLGRGLIDMAKNQATATIFARFGEDRFQYPLKWDVVGKNLFAMFIEGILFFTFTLLIQYRFFIKPRLVNVVSQPVTNEDEDVARERLRVLKSTAETDLLRICNLTKVYRHRKKPAVNRICVGVPAAECFGLLGINGAGKTTTFKMLTGDIPVSSGEAFLNGYSILTQMREVQQNMGYCPQFDAIDDLLTGREHLEFYARLRGVPENEVKMVAEWGIQKLGLVKYSNKSAGTYSGGNKRKLSTAMALIGCPPVIFLDEPTTGMDPKARRFLWDCILSIIKDGRSVILTSHSMEECEALCTRMAIMVNGQFKCLGSIQHLKSRFGDGYTVIVRVGGSPPVLKPVEDFVQDVFPGSILKEKHHNTLQYQLPCGESALCRIFSEFSSRKERLCIEDYSVSQTTLDQVFVNFAKQQDEEEDPQVHVNPVDVTSDEVPMKLLMTGPPAENV
ncbi:phospholipid-transporting ATPase ABCA1 [Amia ocellicauda]|uniref:phospholipid-transporting ATPase ABCA1 n=1 Tax=Amia ocellicauda TaxID=2972642 RepID=UPI0034641967